MSLAADTGSRSSQCAGLTMRDVDLDRQTITVQDKGKTRTIRYGKQTAKAMDAKMRIRDARRGAEDE